MFEIEKNFNVTKEQEEKLLQNAEVLGTKLLTDVYYDNKTYDLTKRGIWLRSRDGTLEAKVSIGENPGVGDRYNEVENEDEIKRLLHIDGEGSLKDLLERYGYFPFCVCKTTRRKYKKEGFNIDIDFAEFEGGFTFEQLEVELMTKDESKVQEAAEKIISFTKPYGLQEVTMGKISSYLKYKKPDHYNVLADLGFWPKKENEQR